MIVKIHKPGNSFTQLAKYLTEDKERVAWSHSLNLAHDDVDRAMEEMIFTAADAELLKQNAGVRAGGRAAENLNLHCSLQWAIGEDPSREHMIETAQGFLRHMGWDEHQAILVAHNDKLYSHVHVMANAIHPETGLKLDDSFSHTRAERWALEYELEHGKVHCVGRLDDREARMPSPTRPAWMAFKKYERDFQQQETALQNSAPDLEKGFENPASPQAEEWRVLKELQREQRIDFFADGKKAFSEMRRSVWLDVREEFRPRWADYFEALKGGDSEELQAYKANLVAEQKSVLNERRDVAYADLKESRSATYKEFLLEQQEIRQALTNRQEAGLENSLFLRIVEQGGFIRAPNELGEPTESVIGRREQPVDAEMAGAGRHTSGAQTDTPEPAFVGRGPSAVRPTISVATTIGLGAISGIGSLADRLADGLVGGPRAPRAAKQEHPSPGYSVFDDAAQAASRQQVANNQREQDEYRKKQNEKSWE